MNMKNLLLLMLLLVAFATPMFAKVLPGFGLATAYAQEYDQGENDDSSGDNNNQGE